MSVWWRVIVGSHVIVDMNDTRVVEFFLFIQKELRTKSQINEADDRKCWISNFIKMK